MTSRTEGIERLALPDMERRLANQIRFGRVLEVNHSTRRVRVKSGEIETAWLRWSAGRAGSSKRSWSPPDIGEQVVVLSPGGDMRQGFVIPGMYQDDQDSPSSNPNQDVTQYGDGTVISYDIETHTLLADFGGTSITASLDQIALVIGGVSITMSSGGVAIVGDVTITGAVVATGSDFTHNGKNVGATHAHSGVQTGPGNTGAPV